MPRGWIVVASVLVGGCSFSAQGSGNAGGDDSESGTSDSAGTVSSSGSNDSMATMASDSNSGGTDTSPTGPSSATDPSASASDTDPSAGATTAGGDALLEFVDAPSYDFGKVDLGGEGGHMFELANSGDVPATELTGLAVTGPFAYRGGSYPGDGGTCGAGLADGESCLIDLVIPSDDLGPVQGVLAVEYQAGSLSAEVDLAATRVGTTSNLLVNGDAEMLGNPPPGWQEVLGDDWQSGNAHIPTHGGSGHFHGGSSGIDSYLMRQEVDVSAYADLISDGSLSINFSGWGASFTSGEDPYSMRVVYLPTDTGAGALGGYDTGDQLGTTWTEYTNSETAPVGTAVVRVRLQCTLDGGVICDGFFDDVSVTVTYNPP